MALTKKDALIVAIKALRCAEVTQSEGDETLAILREMVASFDAVSCAHCGDDTRPEFVAEVNSIGIVDAKHCGGNCGNASCADVQRLRAAYASARNFAIQSAQADQKLAQTVSALREAITRQATAEREYDAILQRLNTPCATDEQQRLYDEAVARLAQDSSSARIGALMGKTLAEMKDRYGDLIETESVRPHSTCNDDGTQCRCKAKADAFMKAYSGIGIADSDRLAWFTAEPDERNYHCDVGFPSGFDITRYQRHLPDTLVGTTHYKERYVEKGIPETVEKDWVVGATLVTITRSRRRGLERYAVRGPRDDRPGEHLTVIIDANSGFLVTGWYNQHDDWHRLDKSDYTVPGTEK